MSASQPGASARNSIPKLVDYFARALTSFTVSGERFRVLCTLPPHGQDRAAAAAPQRPSQLIKHLTVLDSSFNPPTRAHAQMARSALQGVPASARLILLLAVNNADKAPRPASFPLRLGMMYAFALAILNDARGEGDWMIDIAVTTEAYFHDKARAIAASGFYGGPGRGEPEPEQVYLAGFDTLLRIFDPKYYRESSLTKSDGGGGNGSASQSAMQTALTPFFTRARLRVTLRPDKAWGDLEEQRAHVSGLPSSLARVDGRSDWARRVDVAEGGRDGAKGQRGSIGVSSSRVRELVRAHGVDGVDGLVEEEVKAWIESERLYRD